MKLIQLNIWQGRLMMNVLRFFEKAQPDILCLQEVCSSPQAKSYFFDNIQDIQKAMDYPYVYFSPVLGWKMNDLPIQFGNAILSRYPFLHESTTLTFGEYSDTALITDPHARNFQHVTIAGKKGPIHIVNHHGFWFDGDKTGNPETMRQMTQIADYLKVLKGGVIFTGDLNLSPDAPSLERLNTELNNLCLTHNVATTRNFTSFRADQVCDYIYVNDSVDVQKFTAYDDVVSDHSMLELVFE